MNPATAKCKLSTIPLSGILSILNEYLEERLMSIKEEIHALTDEMLTNLGRLVAIDSQLGTPAEGMPFGEGPAKALKVGLKIAEELGFKTVNLDNYCGYAGRR